MIRMGLIAAAFVLAAGCGDDDGTGGNGGSSDGGGGSGAGEEGGGGSAADAFGVRGSVEQVHVWLAEPGSDIELRDAAGDVVASGTTDSLGSLVLRNVPAGEDYEVEQLGADPPKVVSPITVWTKEGSQPAQSFYDEQELVAGYNYITTRDGTRLAAYVTLPGPAEDGPYPTVVNYSGYDPAKPGEPIAGLEALCETYPVLCDKPTDPSAFIAALMGYATVSVNMRGTGCSGGAYDYFEEMQLLDGYDVVETVAAQSWVKHNRVGMTGLSYPGITQMFVAQTQPPSLAAITPLSVIGGTHSTTRPGGIFNKGFALNWITSVLDRADPYGQGWEQTLVDAGDTICEENQLLHGQKVNVIQLATDTPYYTEELVGRVDPTRFVDRVEVPVFLASAWQDEQTGPFFFTLLDRFTSAPVKRFTVYNGVHVDGFSPHVLVEWKTFLDLYVAEEVPAIPQEVRTIAPSLFEEIFGMQVELPPDRFSEFSTWEAAKEAYEAEEDGRALFEVGGGDTAGAPEATFERSFASWPTQTTPLRLYMQPDGSLAETLPVAATGGATFTLDPDAGDGGILAPGGGIWDPLPAYDWKQPEAGSAVDMLSAPLTDDLVMLGTASADLWIRSTVDDADIEINIIEVRPDGQEMFVQTGWLRASLRELATTATDLWPEHTYREEDESLLVPGEWTLVRVGVAGFSHVFRAGSRIRVLVDTPGDSRAEWRFELKTFSEQASYDVGASSVQPSSIVLPVLGGETAPTTLPACPSLRGQQCRAYTPYTNVLLAD